MKAVKAKVQEIVKAHIIPTLQLLKQILLVRHVDRSIREKSIRGIK